MAVNDTIIVVNEDECPHCRIYGAAVLATLARIEKTQEKIMSNQAEEATIAAEIEADVTTIEAAQQTALSEITALQTAAANGQPLDFSAAIQAVADLGTAATGAQAVATAAAPAAPPAAPAS